MMKTVLVTGALGFCARHLLEKLRRDSGLRLCGIDIPQTAPAGLKIDAYSTVDVCDPTRLSNYLEAVKPDVIFHLAGIVGGDPFETYRVNFMGGLHLLEAVRQHVPRSRILLVGSSAEYGPALPDSLPLTEEHPCRPINAYGASKHAIVMAGSDYARNHGLNVVMARPFNIIGPGVPSTLVVGAFLGRIKAALGKGERLVIRMGNLDTRRDFVDVADAVDAYTRMTAGDFTGEIFNICSGKPYSIRSIVETMASVAGLSIEIVQDPALVRHHEIEVSFGSYERAERAFGFSPSTDIEASLLEIWRYETDPRSVS